MRFRALAVQRIIGYLLSLLWVWNGPGLADPLPPLSEEERAAWTMVGRVNGAGIGTRSGCTGTLIAPDLVLTAAHCTGERRSMPSERHFVAGWDRGTFVAHEVSVEVLVHPAYAAAEGNPPTGADIALLRLENPIPADLVRPLPLWPRGSDIPEITALLGYHNERPHILNGSFDCPARAAFGFPEVLVECEVIAGNSGGPVLVRDGEGWQVAAVVVARYDTDGYALAAPVGNWVIGHWQDALDRAAAAAE